AARAAHCRCRRASPRSRARRGARSGRRARAGGRCAGACRRRDPRRAARRRGAPRARGRRARRRGARAARSLADREPARVVRPVRHRSAARRGLGYAAPVDLRPHARGRRRPRPGADRVAVGRRGVAREEPRRAARGVPARVRGAVPGRARRARARLLCDQRARRHVPAGGRLAPAAPRRRHATSRGVHRGSVDRYRMAGHDGGRRAQWSRGRGGGAARARSRAARGGGMRRETDSWGAERGAEIGELARAALDRAVAHLLSLQTASGWWKGELETNVTMDAEDLLMREFLGIRTREETALAANWIRNKQREDGSWATFYRGPADLSTTVEAYAALRLAGDPPEAEHMKRAREVALGLGGIEHTRVFTRIWLALFGEWSWDELPALPPEVILLPAWFPLNVYDFACWARQTIVPLTIVGWHRPGAPQPCAPGR